MLAISSTNHSSRKSSLFWSNFGFGALGFAQKRLQQNWLVVSTQLKNISQIGNLPQIGVKIENSWNHHLGNNPRVFSPAVKILPGNSPGFTPVFEAKMVQRRFWSWWHQWIFNENILVFGLNWCHLTIVFRWEDGFLKKKQKKRILPKWWC